MKLNWKVYLSGEIHSDWREQIIHGAQELSLNVDFLVPQTVHEHSDRCGEVLLGEENNEFWLDHKSARINSIRQNKLIDQADIVVVRFGEKYRQWNAAFDAGIAFAKGKSLITLMEPQLGHALKEINAAALAVAQQPMQVVGILRYVIEGELDHFQ